MPNARDPGWILLAEKGDYSTIRRHREPDDEAIAAAEGALERAWVAGWVAVMSDSIPGRSTPDLLMVRPLREPRLTFDAAVQAFRERADVNST